jgi:ribosome biogenesis GTPase A
MQITEIQSSKYKIKPVKMRNDGIIQGINEPINNLYGGFILLVGRPNSGKSTFFLNLLKKSKKHNSYYRKFDKVFIFSNSLKLLRKI